MLVSPAHKFPAHDYSLYRKSVSSSSGGLLIYVRADLPHRRYVEINEHGFESLCMEITVGKTTTALACIYKQPKLKNDAFKCYLSNMADSLFRTHNDLVFLGDMNCCPAKSTTIQDFCEIYGLTNLITEPTCHKGDVSTFLDVILVVTAPVKTVHVFLTRLHLASKKELTLGTHWVWFIITFIQKGHLKIQMNTT